MNLNLRKQSQFELFPGAPQEMPPAPKSGVLFKDLTLSAENIIVLAIGLLMILVLFFSFGVERGKRSSVEVAPVKVASLPSTFLPVKNQSSIAPVSNQLTSLSNGLPPKVKNSNVSVAVVQSAKVASIPVASTNSVNELPVQSSMLSTGFTMQIATFKSERWAQKEAAILQKKGFQTFTMQKGNFVILCAGRYQNKEDARKIANTLKKQYKDILVRRF